MKPILSQHPTFADALIQIPENDLSKIKKMMDWNPIEVFLEELLANFTFGRKTKRVVLIGIL